VRRFLAFLFAAAFLTPLLGAAPATTLLAPPVLIVYPLTLASASDLDKEAGSRLAVTLAQSIAAAGGVIVKPAPPGTERKNFLEVARAQKADYYISGYITPLGDDVSVVEQLVSTQSGIVVFSSTAQIKTYNDAAGQGDVLHEAILRHQARNIGAYEAPPPPATAATPVPSPSAASEANIGKLFSRKKSATLAATAGAQPTPQPAVVANTGAPSVPPVAAPTIPTPSPAPLPTVAPTRTPPPAPVATATARATVVAEAPAAQVASSGASAGYAVARVNGADAERDEYATQLIERGVTATKARAVALPIEFSETALRGNTEACKDVSAIVSGNLTSHSEVVFGQTQTTASFEIFVLDCGARAGQVAYHRTFQADAGGDWHTAVERAVSSAVGAYLHPPKRRS